MVPSVSGYRPLTVSHQPDSAPTDSAGADEVSLPVASPPPVAAGAELVDDVLGESAVHRAVALPEDHPRVRELVGGEPADVGSGPSLADPSTVEDARELLARYAPSLAGVRLVPTLAAADEQASAIAEPRVVVFVHNVTPHPNGKRQLFAEPEHEELCCIYGDSCRVRD